MLKRDSYATLGRLAVSKDARGLSVGRVLVSHAEEVVKSKWNSSKVVISSQWQVEQFYRKCGYSSTGKEEVDEGWRRELHHEKSICKA